MFMPNGLKWIVPLLLVMPWVASAAQTPPAGEDAAYTEMLNKRAEKIVAALSLADADKAQQIKQLLIEQYRSLKQVHDARDAKLRQLKEQAGPTTRPSPEQVNRVKDEAQAQLDQLNAEFVGRLSSLLTPEQVEIVKNEMTYNVLPITYRGFLDMLPDLTQTQKATILQMLTEAREKAMTGGTSEEKHAWFGKYKGRINNYLSKEGYDLKKASKEWQERLKARQQQQSGATTR
ncbi:DUF3826 domain-containing protein [Fontivita pretiosa]|uniref:DUF3826 domain-containing protein n=1 Tax=Fontivita pretiosa TaxID=2989684 RepID=UPI003D174AFF